MAIATWPSLVPFRSPVDGRTPMQTYSPPVSNETEGGPPVTRPRAGPRFTDVPWQSGWLTLSQWEAFEQFTRYDLAQGTLPFVMPIWRPNGCYVERTCKIKDGTWTSDFSKSPKIRVSFTLTVFNW